MRRLIVTFGGVGYCPVAPGTAGSLVAGLILLGLHYALPRMWPLTPIIAVIILGVSCVMLGRWTVKHFGQGDPGACVIDEAAGMCVAVLFLPTGSAPAAAIGAAFVAFRLFDILKPPPARWLERLPHGWGILMDDLAAGVYANLLSQAVLRWVLPMIWGGG